MSRPGGLRRGHPNPQPQIVEHQIPKANLEQAEDVKCSNPNCDCITFMQLMRLKRISPLMSGTGKETLYPIVITICSKCHTQLMMGKEGQQPPQPSEQGDKPNE